MTREQAAAIAACRRFFVVGNRLDDCGEAEDGAERKWDKVSASRMLNFGNKIYHILFVNIVTSLCAALCQPKSVRNARKESSETTARPTVDQVFAFLNSIAAAQKESQKVRREGASQSKAPHHVLDIAFVDPCFGV